MTRKKGYKKQLPTVLPPPVRPPAPRTSARPETTTPPPAQRPAQRPTAPVQEPATEAASASATPVVAPRVVAPRRPAPSEAAPRVAPAPQVAPGPGPSRSRGPAASLAVAVLLLGVGVGGAAVWWVARDDAPGARRPPAASAGTPGWPAAGTSRTVTEVRADGTVQVTHRIHTTTPIDALDLSLPESESTNPVEASSVEVVADGRQASGPDRVTFTRASYVFDDATTILVRYDLDGVVERSGSAEGRGLVTTTALTVSATQPDDVRVVRSASVLSLACGDSTASLTPCGEADDEGQWTVRLTAGDVGDRVVAAVTVPS
ncbi:hypothetical protein F4692_004081 [Nocardioides cavernae]|uniref:Uncharacterized protein n=1 Tax=Nocardioides cavernae TaxID=1921566 RepID=A0A7Y9H734_9ACTN|nr:hypothetical protein [Nocardioides cavernae]NYE38926.1 hypothetical protein [Nocardioides cavernae]